MQGGKVFIWMNLLGFDRDDSDRGVERFMNQTGFVPDGVCALMCHSDFFHQHKGMTEEYALPPDNCAYWGIPRNSERERQPWTNYDLRTLTENLAKRGTNTYASIFGTLLNNAFHNEWINEHPEVRRHGTDGAPGCNSIFALKRFKDGTYYEDFFIEKLTQTLIDYGMKGVHLADSFCPSGGMLYNIDFSTDYVDQFISHSNAKLPYEILSTMGSDTKEAEEARADWIYKNLRIEWAEFNAWRWEVFFKKLCDRLHAAGKEVIVLGMYCTDPFETRYCNGIDLKRIVQAGVDYISANILPASVFIGGKDSRPDYFHKYMAIASTTAAFIPKGHLISMLGLQDATEEWSMMHHAPTRHERDLYTMMAYHLIDKDGVSRALDGYFLCLGDGICREDWNIESKRLESAMTANAESVVSPVMLWSDKADAAMMKEYIMTRRWTPHKYFYELSKSGAMCAATIKIDGLKNHKGTLFVPNFDMLDEDEQALVLDYRSGAVLCTASPDFVPKEHGIGVSFEFDDKFSTYPIKAFVLNKEISDEIKEEIQNLTSLDDGTENLVGDLANVKEFTYVLDDTLVFSKVTQGFIDAMAKVLIAICDMPFDIDKPHIVLKQKDGAYRLYLFNDSDIKYHRAFVKSKREISDTKTVTDFPILPPRWMEDAKGELHHIYKDGEKVVKKNFEIKIQPAGVTVIDVYF